MVSMLLDLNRVHNSFASALQAFLDELLTNTLSKLFYVAEVNGIIQALIDNDQVFGEHMVTIWKIWSNLLHNFSKKEYDPVPIMVSYPFQSILVQ